MTKHMWNGVQLKKTSSQYAIFKLILSPPPSKNPKTPPPKTKRGEGLQCNITLQFKFTQHIPVNNSFCIHPVSTESIIQNTHSFVECVSFSVSVLAWKPIYILHYLMFMDNYLISHQHLYKDSQRTSSVKI
jgi:hypothetical protein